MLPGQNQFISLGQQARITPSQSICYWYSPTRPRSPRLPSPAGWRLREDPPRGRWGWSTLAHRLSQSRHPGKPKQAAVRPHNAPESPLRKGTEETAGFQERERTRKAQLQQAEDVLSVPVLGITRRSLETIAETPYRTGGTVSTQLHHHPHPTPPPQKSFLLPLKKPPAALQTQKA